MAESLDALGPTDRLRQGSTGQRLDALSRAIAVALRLSFGRRSDGAIGRTGADRRDYRDRNQAR